LIYSLEPDKKLFQFTKLRLKRLKNSLNWLRN
jgi:hypothetical protein